MKKSKMPSYAVPPFVQLVLMTSMTAAFLAQNGLWLYWVIRQYPSNSNLSGFLLIALISFLVPATMFILALWLSKQRDKRLRLFESFLFAAMGSIAAGVLNIVSNFIYSTLVTTGSGYWQSVGYEIGAHVVLLALYICFLLYTRKHS